MDPLRSPSRGSMAESPSKRKLKEENPTLYTLNKLKTFFDEHAFDTEGPYADLFSVLLSTCRHLVDVNISQTLRNKQNEAQLAALNGEMGALSVFAAEQIKEEDDRLQLQQQRRRSSSRGSFLFQKPDGQKAPSLTASALREEIGEAARGGSAEPQAVAEGGEGEGTAEGPSYTLHKTLYSVLKNKIAEQAASHHRLLEHVQWMTPQIARLEEQQLEILKQLDAVRETLHQTNVTVRRASSVANSPSAAAAAARRASAVLRENEERQSAAPAGALAQQIHDLGDGLRTCEAELRVLRSALQRGTRAASLSAGRSTDEAEVEPATAENSGSGAQAFVTREELAACLKERDRNINWALLDVQEEVERRGDGKEKDDEEDDEEASPSPGQDEERGPRRQRGSVQIAAATGFAPSRLATDLSRKLQLILYTVAEKQIEKNVAYLLLRQNEERYADVESRLEVLEVYSPHQRQVAVRPPLLGVELEDFALTYNNSSDKQQQQQGGAPAAVATAQQVRGVRVKKVYGNYPAAAAGLAPDDVIVAVASEEVHSRADLYSVLLELSQQYRCRCQLLMERAFLRETMVQLEEGEGGDAAKSTKEEAEEEAQQLRGYRAFAPFLPAQEGEAAESVRAQQLRQALPRFELPMTILRKDEFYNISVLIPSSMALSPSDE